MKGGEVASGPMGPPAPETLRAHQRARRDRIVKAALRRLVSSDYDSIKVSDVAKDAKVALGTLYRYFTSKEHLFAAVFYEWQESFGRQIQASPPAAGSEGARLREFLGRTIRAFQVQPQFYKLLLVIQMTSDPYAAEIYVSLDQGFRRIFDSALGPTAESARDRDAIFATVECVLDKHLARWVVGRCSIEDAYEAVDEAIRLIYEFPRAA
jgi:TetR/AcrR family transcriptional regulator, cholesterol catabolism regulator